MVLVPLFDLKFLTEFAAAAVGTSNRRHETRAGVMAKSKPPHSETPSLTELRRERLKLISVTPVRMSLEDYFMTQLTHKSDPNARGEDRRDRRAASATPTQTQAYAGDRK